MSSSTSAIFTGNSQFATSFQQSISRAIQFASLPMQQMQSDVASLQAQSSELDALNTRFSALQSSLTSLASALGLGSYTAASSASTVATVSLSETPSMGSYTVEVDSLGTYASAMSGDGLATVADPAKTGISDATRYTLTVGTQTYSFSTGDATLCGLADAINSSVTGVQATVVNIGTQGAADYRLSVQDSKMEPVAIQLASLDGSAPNAALLSPQTDGAPTTYRVNGKPAVGSDPLETSESNIILAPGVSVRLLGTGSTVITVGRSTDTISSALSGFVTVYNAAQTEINSNRGQGTGALQGESLLSTLSGVLQQLSGYADGSQGISSLSSLGLSFDKNGVLSFDSAVFATATSGKMGQLADFLGSTTDGGFLQAAHDALTVLTDSTGGLIGSSIEGVRSAIDRENQSIGDEQERIANLQSSLNAQMAAADAAIAALEQQYGYFSAMFQQMRVNSQNG